MNGEIYVIRNTVNTKVYIGQTTQGVDIRFKQHLKLLKSSENQLIHKAIKKYGKDKFYYEVLESNITSIDELNRLEEEYIIEFNSLAPNGYNIHAGGNQPRRKSKLSEEQQKEIVKLYNDGLSSREIANIFNSDKQTILGILHRNGCKTRDKTCNLPDRSSKIEENELRELYLNKKLSRKEIAKELNTSVSSVNRAIKRFNMKRI